VNRLAVQRLVLSAVLHFLEICPDYAFDPTGPHPIRVWRFVPESLLKCCGAANGYERDPRAIVQINFHSGQ
jgi:hypothetical protein